MNISEKAEMVKNQIYKILQDSDIPNVEGEGVLMGIITNSVMQRLSLTHAQAYRESARTLIKMAELRESEATESFPA